VQTKNRLILRLPGFIATGLMIIFTTFWAYWGSAEMYHEGWWGAWYNRLSYLAPGAICLVPTLVAIAWPIVGGALIIGVGIFYCWLVGLDDALLGVIPIVVGILFILDGVIKRRTVTPPAPDLPWWRRNLRYLLATIPSFIVFVGVSVVMLPVVLTRVDDGDRGARLIEGNGVTLIWAPEGPGWNWKQPWGGYPSWQSIALYGLPPVGMEDKPGYGRQGDQIVFATAADMATYNLCRYLSEDGLALMEEPQDVWRMPTTDEMVRSLVRHGENAHCNWNGEFRTQVSCLIKPDKESPLWTTAYAPIYYWTADEYNERRAYFVCFNGTVSATSKTGGNPRHSYRCVREPD
jgi:hypothetical protein